MKMCGEKERQAYSESMTMRTSGETKLAQELVEQRSPPRRCESKCGFGSEK